MFRGVAGLVLNRTYCLTLTVLYEEPTYELCAITKSTEPRKYETTTSIVLLS